MKLTINAVANRTFFIEVPYEAKDKFKDTVDSCKWDKKNKWWEVPGSMDNLMKLASNFEVDYSSINSYVKILSAEQDKVKYINKIRNDPSWRLNGEYEYLYRHQCVALEAARSFNQYALFLDTGTGKTLTSIEIIKHYKKRTLVVCPLTIIEDAWLSDIKKFAPQLVAVNLWASNKEKRLQKLKIPSHICIINFEGLKILEKELMKQNFGVIIVDESSKMKDPNSQITKCLLRFAKHIPNRYILSGSPASNSPLEYWAQMNFIDLTILGSNFYRYRNQFFTSDYMGYNWFISNENRKKIMERIKRKAIFFSKDECLDLPEKIFQVRKIQMSDDQKAAYKNMKNDLVIELRDTIISASNQVTKIMKLRQVTSGFVYNGGKPIKIADTKFKELINVLDEIGNHQVIIWVNFHFEGHALMDNFKDRACALWGNIKDDVRRDSIEGFKCGKYQYLIANPASAAHGLTFVNCQYAVYFSLSYSAELWKESQDRIHRIGQTKNATYIYLLCEKSIEEKIYEALQNKRKISEECLGWLK